MTASRASGRGPSLTVRLLVSLALTQAAVIIVASAALITWIADRSVGYVNKAIADDLAASISVQPNGLRVTNQAKLEALAAAHPQLWWLVTDESGHRLAFGPQPPELQGLEGALPMYAASDLNAKLARADLSARIDSALVDGQRVHLMVGGGRPAPKLQTMAYLALFFTPWFALPLIVLSAVAIALSVYRATRGIHAVARQAEALELSDQTAHLSEQAVPREIRPLVRAFNAALDRIKLEHQARDRFLRDAAHEIRVPMAVLIARVESMGPQPIKTELLTDLSRLTNLTEQLLDLERLRGRTETMDTLDLAEIAREVVADMAPLALSRGNELRADVPDGPVPVTGQQSALARVVTNLVQNALIHGGSPGTVSVTVRPDRSLEVADEGAGVAADARGDIFRPFFRGTASATGHGLGLHLVEEIVRLHGGHVGVGQRPGGGARFRVQLLLRDGG